MPVLNCTLFKINVVYQYITVTKGWVRLERKFLETGTELHILFIQIAQPSQRVQMEMDKLSTGNFIPKGGAQWA